MAQIGPNSAILAYSGPLAPGVPKWVILTINMGTEWKWGVQKGHFDPLGPSPGGPDSLSNHAYVSMVHYQTRLPLLRRYDFDNGFGVPRGPLYRVTIEQWTYIPLSHHCAHRGSLYQAPARRGYTTRARGECARA